MSDAQTESGFADLKRRHDIDCLLLAAVVMLGGIVPAAYAQGNTESEDFGQPTLTSGITDDAHLIRQVNDIFMVANHLCEAGDIAQCSTLGEIIKSGFNAFLYSRDCIEGVRSGCENYAVLRAQINDFYPSYKEAYGVPNHDAIMLDMPSDERGAEWASKLTAIFAPEARPINPCEAIIPHCGQFDADAMRENQLYFLELIGAPASAK